MTHIAENIKVTHRPANTGKSAELSYVIKSISGFLLIKKDEIINCDGKYIFDISCGARGFLNDNYNFHYKSLEKKIVYYKTLKKGGLITGNSGSISGMNFKPDEALQ